MSKKTLPPKQLEDLRASIDHLDHALLFLLAERLRLTAKITTFKKAHHLPVTHSLARKKDLKKIFYFGLTRNLRFIFIKELFHFLYQAALKQKVTSDNFSHTLNDLRESMFNLDSSLCTILAERFHLAHEVGKFKKIHDIRPLVKQRWQILLRQKITIGKKLGIDPKFIQGIFTLIHRESLHIQGTLK